MLRMIGRCAVVLVCFASVLSAQSGYAIVSGRVNDASGGVMPGVVITAQNVNTNVALNAVTNGEGYYTLADLIPGTYTVRAQAPGFKNLERADLVLRVGDRVAIDLVMEVGLAAERVTVTGEVPLLRTDDAQSGMVIDNRRIQQLPAYDRNALAFATLTANVNGTSTQEGHNTDFRINGGRSAQAEYFIDGVPVTTGYQHNVPSSVPSMEAVGEFNVVTNGLSAEYGRLSGGAVVLVTRAGTNQFHGSGYEYFRNNILNANDWNSNRYGVPIGVFHDNVFGGTLGGPVVIPKLYNGHNKTFFFFNYEGTRHNSGNNATLAGVPTALERQGDFSQSLIDKAVPVQIYDPLTGQSAANGDTLRQPFPGNIIPQSRFDPLSKVYLGYYPLPNHAPLPGSSHQSNFLGTSTNPTSDDRWTGRLDQNWNSNHISHFTLTRDDNKSTSPNWLSPLQTHSVSWATSHTVSFEHTWTVSPSLMLDFRAGVVRIASWAGSQVDANSSGWPMQSLITNLIGTTQGRVPSLSTADTITTLGGGNVNNNFETNLTANFSLQKLWGKHALKAGYDHRRYYSNLYSAFGAGVGSFTESTLRSVTSQSNNNPIPTGMGFASWLLGAATTGSGTQFAGPASLQPYHGAYIQDAFKATTKLTLNYGVRWDFEPPRTERYNRQFYWDENYVWPWTPSPGWSWNQALQQAGVSPSAAPTPAWITNGIRGRLALMGTPGYPGRASTETHPYHFSPRFGIAYEFMPRTVLRGSYGINWMTVTGSQYVNSADRNVGFGDAARFNGTSNNGLTYPLTFSNPMPGGAGYIPFSHDVPALNVASMGTWLVAPSHVMTPGYEHTIAFGIQHQLGSGENSWVVEVNYNAELGRGLPFYLGFGEHVLPNSYGILGPLGDKLNAQISNPFYGQVPAGTGMGGPTIPFGRLFQLNPLWLEIWTVGGPYGNSQAPSVWGVSNYHAIYFQVEHRFGKGFSFLANYTISKLLQDTGGIDNGQPQGQGEQAQPQAGGEIGSVYGLAPSDITHKFQINYSIDLPVGRGKRLLGNAPAALDKVIGGWQLAGTTLFRSGQPISVYTPSGAVGGLGSQWYNIGQGRNNRPVMLSGQPLGMTTDGHAALIGSANAQYYVNPAAFRLTQGWEIGNVGSTFPNWRGPGFSQWDLSLMKNISLGKESRRLQLRFEAQNLLNHMNAGNPDSGVTDLTFGQIITQSGLPRRVMAAAKLYF
jgi:hypothetical protein